jgi:hypothetical protein
VMAGTCRAQKHVGEQCAREAVLRSDTVSQVVQPGSVSTQFIVSLEGATPTTAAVELCAYADNRLVYHDRWDVKTWFVGPAQITKSDSAVLALLDHALSFRTFSVERVPWFRDLSTNAYAAVALDLKQAEYREQHHLSRMTILPKAIRDSLERAPVDSARVRSVVRELEAGPATTLSYWTGDEGVREIAWWNGGRRFVTTTWY